jgi:hypothetical protein
MISTHFSFNRKQRSLTAVLVAVLAAVIGGCILTWAQSGDTPITISDGSLTMHSAGHPWANWGTSNPRPHPEPGKSVTQVVVAMPGHNQTFQYSGQQCTVAVTYASTAITVRTGGNGRGLQIDTNWSAFHAGADAYTLAHNNTTSKISHVTVRQGNQTVFNFGPSGAGDTIITIHYQ